MSLVIVGSIGLDTISTPAGEVKDALGGSAIYGAIAGSYFCPIHMVGILGTDFPESGLTLLKEHGVDIRGLEFQEGKTFRWSGKYCSWNRAETISTELNVFADFSPVIPEAYKKCKSILLANIDPELQLSVLEQIDNKVHTACDTMNYWIQRCPDKLQQVLQKVNIVFMNEDEIRDFTGMKDIFSAARALLELGPEWVIVKRGEYGSVAISASDLFFAPAYPVEEVKDPTGAGDSFAGAFMGYLGNHECLSSSVIRNAVRYGSVLAAMNVKDFSIEGLIGKQRRDIDDAKEQLIKWTS